jgi:hypothetical protein
MTVRGRIGRWHKGKLVILWAWAAVVVVGSIAVALQLPSNSTASALTGFALFLVTPLAPAAMSIVTWIWLGGREQDEQS